MSSPLDLASGTNSWAVYKECHGDCQIHQFDACKSLWAYLICVSEEIWVVDHTKVKDPVLHHLMAIGAWD